MIGNKKKSDAKFRLASSIDNIVKFKPSSTSLASTCDFATSRTKFGETSTSLNAKCKNDDQYVNLFRHRRCNEESKFAYCQPKDKNQNRYGKLQNTSSFLHSILDGSSDIFSIRSRKQNREQQGVRKPVTNEDEIKAAVLYDEDNDLPDPWALDISEKFNPKSAQRNLQDETVNVTLSNEIDAYLKNDQSSFIYGSKKSVSSGDSCDKDLPNFGRSGTNIPNIRASCASIPDEPELPKMENIEQTLADKLNQIVTVSEIFQPDEDDLAERILSKQNVPLNVNFNIESNMFEVDYDLVPSDNRLRFTAIENFTCMALNHDQPVKVCKQQALQLLSCDCNGQAFGYLLDESAIKEPLMIPLNKVSSIDLCKYPKSDIRGYEVNNWCDFPETSESYDLPSISSESDSVSSNTTSTEDKLELGKSQSVQRLGFFDLDFNTHPMTRSLTKEISSQESLKILTVMQGDIICITSSNPNHKWVEGYLANDPECKLGLAHLGFIKNF